MTYRFFEGCANVQDVKTKFRELARKHHPDMGGSHDAFVTLRAEYESVVDTTYLHNFPLKNSVKYTYNTNDDIEEMFRKARTKKEAEFSGFKSGPTGRQYTKEQQEINYWARKENEELTFNLVRDAYEESKLMNRSANWMLFEIYKVENLGLENFKHLAWMLRRDSDNRVNVDTTWINTVYRNYVESWKVKWPY